MLGQHNSNSYSVSVKIQQLSVCGRLQLQTVVSFSNFHVNESIHVKGTVIDFVSSWLTVTDC
jgi:hypothetical protein